MKKSICVWLAGAAGVAMISSLALAQTAPQANAPAPLNPPGGYVKATFGAPDYTHLTEGSPVDTRTPEHPTAKPLYPEQTHAPYHKSADFQVIHITDALAAPWAVAFLPDGKFLVTEKLPGALRVVDANGAISAPVKGLENLGVTWPETGLFDLVLDPKFASNHKIYFTFFAFDHGMVSNIQVASATFDEAANSLSNVKVIFRGNPMTPNDGVASIGSRSGGRMVMGKDGYLYVTMGDRDINGPTTWRVAQTLDTDLGKIVRITTDGKPAPGNPFIGQADARPEIWSIGMRSEEGLVFDSKGQLWETEDGPRGGDELNLVKKGGNYGWPTITYGIDYGGAPIGDQIAVKPGLEQPVYYWSPSVAPSGLVFYDGNLFPQWKGDLFSGALRGMALIHLKMQDGKVVSEEPLLTDLKKRIRDVRVGPDGALYVLTDSGGGSIADNTPSTSMLLKLIPK